MAGTGNPFLDAQQAVGRFVDDFGKGVEEHAGLAATGAAFAFGGPLFGLIGGATGGFGLDDQKAAKDAADAQRADQRRAANAIGDATADAQAGLDPYAQAGTDALTQQRDLAGLNGPEAQQRALAMLEASPQFASMIEQGEEAILANASATGGLRGGDTQGALAQFRPALLDSLIQQQYAILGGLAGAGQQAAAQQGAFGMQGALGRADVFADMGNNAAGSILSQQAALNNGRNQAFNLGSQVVGLGATLATGAPVSAPQVGQQQAPPPPVNGTPRGGF